MAKKYLVCIPVVFTLFSSFQVAHAAPAQKDTVDRVYANVDKWTEQALKWQERFKGGANLSTEKLKEQRDKICNNVQERVDARWASYYARRTDRSESMDRGIKILEKRLEFYRGKGLDVTGMATDVAHLKALVAEYNTAYAQFLTALGEAKTLPCANHQGEFLPKLKVAKDQWVVVKQKADAIRDYYRDTVKKHLEELRVQPSVERKLNETESN